MAATAGTDPLNTGTVQGTLAYAPLPATLLPTVWEHVRVGQTLNIDARFVAVHTLRGAVAISAQGPLVLSGPLLWSRLPAPGPESSGTLLRDFAKEEETLTQRTIKSIFWGSLGAAAAVLIGFSALGAFGWALGISTLVAFAGWRLGWAYAHAPRRALLTPRKATLLVRFCGAKPAGIYGGWLPNLGAGGYGD